MIEDNALENKLNDFKKQEESSSGDSSPLIVNPYLNLLDELIHLIIFLLKVVSFGFSIKIIFNTDWKFLSTVCVGLAITFLLNYIYDLIRDNNQNSFKPSKK